METDDSTSSEDSLHSLPMVEDITHSIFNPSAFEYLDYSHVSCVSQAAAFGEVNLLRELLQNGQNVNSRDNMNCTALHMAMLKNNMEMLNVLLEHPEINLDAINYEGDTPLVLGIGVASNEMIYRLLDAGCKVNCSNLAGTTPLHVAVTRAPSLIHDLIKRGADVNALSDVEGTPLHVAVRVNNFESVCTLLYYNADTTMAEDRITPFLLAIANLAKVEIIYELFYHCSDFSVTDHEKFNCVLLALNTYNPIIKDLLDVVGKEINQVTTTGYSALHLAVFFPDNEVFKIVYSKINHKVLLKCSLNILKLIIDSSFPKEQWLECMYLILESPVIVDLLHLWKESITFFTYLFVSGFKQDNIEFSDRVKIITAFLSYGTPVFKSDINLAYVLYGLGDELFAFTTGNYVDVSGGEDFCMIVRYIMGKENLYFDNIEGNQKFSNVDVLTSNFYRQNILTLSSYFSFPSLKYAVDRIEKRNRVFNVLFSKIEGLPKVPTLMELARNKLRIHIIKKFYVVKTYQFYNVVNKLNLPHMIKRIVLFQVPLYVVNYREETV